MLFEYPHLLWLLPLVPALAYVNYRAGGPHRALITWLRAACVAALVLALARPMLSWQSVSPTTVVVVDLDPSVAANALMAVRRDLKAASGKPTVIAFASRATVVNDPAALADPAAVAALGRRLAAPLWDDDAPAGGANLAAALQLAGAQVPPDGRGSVRLYTDGRSDHGDAAAEAYRLAQRGIAVRVVPVDAGQGALPPTVVRRVSVPATAWVGQTVDAAVQLESAEAGTVTIRLVAGDGTPVSATATVMQGTSEIRVALPLPKAGLAPVRATVQEAHGMATTGRRVRRG